MQQLLILVRTTHYKLKVKIPMKTLYNNEISINLIQFTGLKIIFRLELIKMSRQNYFFSDVIHISITSNLDKSHPPLPLLSPSPSPSPFYKTRILTMLLLYMRPRNSSWQEKWCSGNTCKFVHTSITSVHGLTFIPTEVVKVIKLRLACLLTSELTSRIHMNQWFDTMQDYINFVLTERKGYTSEYWPEVVAVRAERKEVRRKTTKDQYFSVGLE